MKAKRIFRKRPKIPFCSNKWADSENQVHSSILNNLCKLDQIESSSKVILQSSQF